MAKREIPFLEMDAFHQFSKMKFGDAMFVEREHETVSAEDHEHTAKRRAVEEALERKRMINNDYFEGIEL